MSKYMQSSRDSPWNSNVFPSYVSQNNFNYILYPKRNFRDGSTILTTIPNDYLFFLIFLRACKIFFSLCIKAEQELDHTNSCHSPYIVHSVNKYLIYLLFSLIFN